MSIEFGLDTFGDITRNADGELLTGAQTIRNIVAQAELADTVGVDFFGVGSTTARSSRSLPRRWCWPLSRPAPSTSVWARR